MNIPNGDNMELLYWLIHQAPLLLLLVHNDGNNELEVCKLIKELNSEIVVGGRESDTWLI